MSDTGAISMEHGGKSMRTRSWHHLVNHESNQTPKRIHHTSDALTHSPGDAVYLLVKFKLISLVFRQGAVGSAWVWPLLNGSASGPANDQGWGCGVWVLMLPCLLKLQPCCSACWAGLRAPGRASLPPIQCCQQAIQAPDFVRSHPPKCPGEHHDSAGQPLLNSSNVPHLPRLPCQMVAASVMSVA